MNSELIIKVFSTIMKEKGQAEITVNGISMNPTLYEKDKIKICRLEDYNIGDILVYQYEDEGLLVHRLLSKKEGIYFCKGDNAFRMEEVEKNKIFGKVTEVNGKTLEIWPEWKTKLSYQINCDLKTKYDYDIEKTKKSSIYKLYKNIILRNEDETMKYKKNENMEYIQADETSLAVFDAESGNTHFFNETAIDILNCISDPCDLEELLNRLCKIYAATPEEIRGDVEKFLAETVESKVVEVI